MNHHFKIIMSVAIDYDYTMYNKKYDNRKKNMHYFIFDLAGVYINEKKLNIFVL
jgi:hypothetical protein